MVLEQMLRGRSGIPRVQGGPSAGRARVVEGVFSMYVMVELREVDAKRAIVGVSQIMGQSFEQGDVKGVAIVPVGRT